ncbi:hypothetical protein J6590_070352 [Homalodisca vitripennis]|nr:hypothetical protein J6590_070352 [Homalodisca vitripennis]
MQQSASQVHKIHNNLRALKFIYCSRVRQVLEFSTVVWSPIQVGHIRALQQIQDKFLRIVGVRHGLHYRDVPVEASDLSFCGT